MPKPVVLPPPKWVLNPNTKMTSGVVGLVHFGQFFPNFCFRYCCLSRVKNINDHLFPLKQSVGHELPSPDSYCVVHDGG